MKFSRGWFFAWLIFRVADFSQSDLDQSSFTSTVWSRLISAFDPFSRLPFFRHRKNKMGGRAGLSLELSSRDVKRERFFFLR